MKHFIVLLVVVLIPTLLPAEETTEARVKLAIDKGLERIKAGVTNYPEHRQCFSCHHQAMAVLSLTAARQRGFKVEEEMLDGVIEFSVKSFKNKAQIARGQGVGGDSVSVVYALHTFAAVERPRDETIAALVQYLLARQRKEGHWPAPAQRPPTMGSPYTATGLAVSALKHYSPAKDADGAAALQKQIDTAIEKGRDWLLANKPSDTEDRVFHLRGLVDAGVEQKVIVEARDKLLSEQHADGSWSQLRDKDGDAYATATALTALSKAGLEVGHDAYKKGVAYLLKNQKEDGAWVVPTRSRPLQLYFDNGDAGGRSQFVSFAATNWAVIALLETLPTMTR